MSKLFAKSIRIKNFRCFKDATIGFSVPDGETIGSGLNIIVGENGCGKTTILEAYNLLTQSSYTIENRLSITDFHDFKLDLVISSDTDEFKCNMPYPGCYYHSKGFEVSAKPRSRKAPGKLLSSPFSINSNVRPTSQNYYTSKGIESKEIIPFYTQTRDDVIDGDGINVFLFDKNRTRQLTSGTYKTTFSRICDDLNWKFAKGITPEVREKLLKNITGEYFKLIHDTAQKGTGAKLANDLSQYFKMDSYKDLRIELLNLLHPFTEAFFAVREEADFKQIMAKDLGSGIEMVLTLLLLKSIAGESKGSTVYLIDEPELHLHPKAQDKLIEMLLEESKTKQVIISTHSPYIFRNCLKKAGSIILMNYNDKKEIEICYPNKNDWSLVPWGPSWGEINYFAFKMPTVEFHNELYGYLQEKSDKYHIDEFDKWLNGMHNITLDCEWIKQCRGGTNRMENVTLQTFIRNSIHHPENLLNTIYTDAQLQKSVDKLTSIIRLENNKVVESE